MTTITRDDEGMLNAYAWPGGYQMYYMTQDGGVLCPFCASHNGYLPAEGKGWGFDSDGQWEIVAVDINYEDESMYCDHCNGIIPASYGDDEPEIDWRDTAEQAFSIADTLFV